MDTSETHCPPNSPPACVLGHNPAPEARSPAKRKPRLANEGRGPHDDEKRIRRYSAMPDSRSTSGRSSTKAVGFCQDLKMKAAYMTADSLHDIPVGSRKFIASRIPTVSSTKLLFPPPLLALPPAAENTVRRPLPSSRKSSYERRHRGPHFIVYEDRTSSNLLFLSSYSHPFLPWDLSAPAPAPAARQGRAGSPESNQENHFNGAHETSTPDHTDREPNTYLAVTSTADRRVAYARSRTAVHQVSEQAIKILRMMR